MTYSGIYTGNSMISNTDLACFFSLSRYK